MKVFVGLFLAACVIAVGIFFFTPSTQGQKKDNDEPTIVQKAEFPVMEYAGAVPDANSEERKARGKYFDRSYYGKITETKIEFITDASCSVECLPAIPVAQSSLILTGTVTDSHAFLSKNKTTVYSEFSLKVDKLIRTDNGIAVTPDDIIALDRRGGRVKFPSGHIQSYVLSGAGALEVGGEYIVFVKREEALRGFLLVTAFKIVNKKILPVDDTLEHPKYNDLPLTEFLQELENRISDLQNKDFRFAALY